MPSNLVCCGTYTDPSPQAGFEVSPEKPVMGMTGPTGSDGIYAFRRDRDSGKLNPLGVAGTAVNPSFLIEDSSGRYLFAVSEIRQFRGKASGAVSSFAIDRETGKLRFISQVASEGGNPCHLSMSASGRFLMVANHEAGNVAVIPVVENGSLSAAIQVQTDEPVDHRQPHAHFITPDPSGRFVVSSDTGTDRVMIYRQDPTTGKLEANDPAFGQTHSGGSPRHLSFTPTGKYLFANGEADLTLSLFRFDPDRGVLEQIRSLPTVPRGMATDQCSTAQMLVHPSGKFVYVANRGSDTIATFQFDEAAERLEFIALEPTRGKTPRFFQFDPSGGRLYVANQNSDSIESFAIDRDTGGLRHEGKVANVLAPTCILFSRQ
jgi:6-phosphogluconolactonase